MNSAILAAAILAHVAQAAWSDDVKAVSSYAASIDSQVKSWSSGDGLQGALGIQGGFGSLSDAVGSLSKDGSSVSASDIDPSALTSFSSAIVSLLDDLVKKAQDFSSVGASSIVGGDLKNLGQPAADIVSDIIKAVSTDCEKVSSLTGALNSLADGFSSANSAYSQNEVKFPAAPSCNGGSGGSSAAGSSAAGSSAAATSGAASSAATSAASSAAATSGAASSAPAVASSGSGSGSGVGVATGAGSKVVVGLAAVGAGAVAMLI